MPHPNLGKQMASEMAEQPAVLAHLIGAREELRTRVAECYQGPLAGTVIVARGSSDHAATCGRYLLEAATRRPVSSASPSVHTLYDIDMDFRDYVVIAVSQSGRTPEIAAVLERAGRAGARTIAITNDAGSPLAGVANAVVDLGAGEELAVPATKTVTAEIAAFALIAQSIGDVGIDDDAWARLPRQVDSVLQDPEPASHLAAWLAGEDRRFATVARGYLYGAAAECALKIEETTAILSTPFSSADLRHGPIAVASTGLPVLAFAHPGPVAADVLALAADLRERGASVRIAGPVPGTSASWATDVPEALAPVLAVVRSQQLAIEVARRYGREPDAPRGLTKVTVT
jgi:glucosamine--fructose-6-phosphate aminotransferase (isomerizing)